MESFTINVPVIITTEDIDDIMETAADSRYGCSWFERFKKIDGGWAITHEDVEADEAETYTTGIVAYSQLLAAIQTYFANRRTVKDAWVRFDDELAHMIDVNVADCIAQYAVYGEVVFG